MTSIVRGLNPSRWVFLARDEVTGDVVICKAAKEPTEKTDKELLNQYRQLFRFSSPLLNRPIGIFRHETGAGSELVLALEYVEGETLEDWHIGKPLSELLRRLALVASAIAVYAESGERHGDVHSENVLVGRDRVVLIDPETHAPSRWSQSASNWHDLVQWAVMARGLLGPNADLVKSVLSKIERDEGALRDATAVAEAVTLAAEHVPPDLSLPMEEIARVQLADRADRALSFASDRAAYDVMVRQIRDLLAREGAPFRYEVGLEIQGEEQELRSLGGDLGWITQRTIVGRGPEVAIFSLQFAGDSSFQKPWPWDDEGFLRRTTLDVQTRAGRQLAEPLAIRRTETGLQVVIVGPKGQFAQLTPFWAKRVILMAEGLRIAGIESPLVPESKGALLHRPVAKDVWKGIRDFLVRPATATQGTTQPGSSLSEVFNVGNPSRRASIIRRVASEELPSNFSSLRVIYRFDVSGINRAARTLDVELWATLGGNAQPEEPWSANLAFPAPR